MSLRNNRAISSSMSAEGKTWKWRPSPRNSLLKEPAIGPAIDSTTTTTNSDEFYSSQQQQQHQARNSSLFASAGNIGTSGGGITDNFDQIIGGHAISRPPLLGRGAHKSASTGVPLNTSAAVTTDVAAPSINSEDFECMVSDLRRSFTSWLRTAELSLDHVHQQVNLERRKFLEEKEASLRNFERMRDTELERIRAERVRAELEAQSVLKQISAEREDARNKVKEERKKFENERAMHKRAILVEQNRLAKEAENLDVERRRIMDTNIATESQVEINVGGTIYQTSRHTVTQFPGSFLEALFSGRHNVSRDRGGRVFLDRDSDLFRLILNYLRNPETPPPTKNVVESDLLCKEAQYYGVRFFPFPLVYAIGGNNGTEYLSSVEVLDIAQQVWRHCRPLEMPRTYFSSGAVNNRIYVCGGQNLDYKALCDVECYDVLRDEWLGGPAMLFPRRNVGGAVIGNRIYSCGGFDGVNILSSAEALDLRVKNWMEIAPMKSPRASPLTAVLNERLYVMGGSKGERLRTVEVYDPRMNTWEDLGKQMLEVRSSGVAGTLMDSVFVLGGVDGGQKTHSSVEMLNPDTEEWTFRKSMPEPRMDLGAVVVENCILVAGGQRDGEVLDVVDFYRVESDEWQRGPSLLNPRYGHKLVTVNL